jgi:hypothetical protein
MLCLGVGCLQVCATCQIRSRVQLWPALGSSLTTWPALVCLKPTKGPSPGRLEDHTLSQGHDHLPSKAFPFKYKLPKTWLDSRSNLLLRQAFSSSRPQALLRQHIHTVKLSQTLYFKLFLEQYRKSGRMVLRSGGLNHSKSLCACALHSHSLCQELLTSLLRISKRVPPTVPVSNRNNNMVICSENSDGNIGMCLAY